jgi:hypothetical protein
VTVCWGRNGSSRVGGMSWLVGEGRSLGGEVGKRPRPEVFEDGVLALEPGVVQRAGAALAAGALLHDAVGDLERALHGLHGAAQGYLFGRSGEAGTSPPFPRWSPQDQRARASPSRGRADGAAPRPRTRSCRPSPARRSPHSAPGTPASAVRNDPRSRVRASSVPSLVSPPKKIHCRVIPHVKAFACASSILIHIM